MSQASLHGSFPGRLIVVGYGSIAEATMPLLLRHFIIAPERITIIAPHGERIATARQHGINFLQHCLTEHNYRTILTPLLSSGDFLLNLSVDVASLALIQLCQECGVLYLDTSLEPWAGGYTNQHKSLSQRSNYALREEVLAFRRNNPLSPTAVITCGANPGLASLFVKQALLNMADDNGITLKHPNVHEEWAELAFRLGIKAIHIAERDTQTSLRHKPRNEFVNTWSVSGFISESVQPAELGWGSHEHHWPTDAARHSFGCDAAIYLNRPGASTQVRSWTPLEGPYIGQLITHNESISITDHLTLKEHGQMIYRPTVHYAYYPCDDALLSLHELAGKNWQPQTSSHILRDEIDSGMDELGILLMGNDKGVYWYGSRLTIAQARALAPYNNATSLQVVAGIIAGIVWALRNPTAGIVEPDDLDHRLIMEIAAPYLGELVGVYGDWNPLQNRSELFDEELDREDPWQFINMRIV